MLSKHDLEVLYTVSALDLKVRYQNSKLGMAWSLLRPILQFFAYYIVFGIILKVGRTPDYAIRLFLGIIIWSLFTESTGNSLTCYLSKKSIITKIHVKKELLPISCYLTGTFNFLLTFSVFVIVYIVYAIQGTVFFKIDRLHVFIIFFLTYSLFIISVNMILANINALFRDIQAIWDLILSYFVFLSPIMYTLDIPEKYMNIYYFVNPIAFPVEEMRSCFFGAEGNWDRPSHMISYLMAVLLWGIIATVADKRLKSKVSDFL